MKKLLFALLLLPCALVCHAQTNEDADVINTITGLFGAMQKYDTTAMRRFFHSDARLQSAITNSKTYQTRLYTESIDSFLIQVAGLQKDSVRIEERLLGFEVRTDDPMASVWVPYEFYVNGKLSHTGVDSFQLFRTSEGWRISQICDTRRKKKK